MVVRPTKNRPDKINRKNQPDKRHSYGTIPIIENQSMEWRRKKHNEESAGPKIWQTQNRNRAKHNKNHSAPHEKPKKIKKRKKSARAKTGKWKQTFDCYLQHLVP